VTLYDELGVAPDADETTIKAAHRRAAKLHHPDLGGDRERFDRIQLAFEILSDPDRRRRYDQTGQADDLPASSEQQAVLALVRETLMAIVMGQDDLTQVDPKRLANLEKGFAAVDHQLQRLETVRQRLSRQSPDGEDLLLALIQHQEYDLNLSRPNIEKGIRMANAAIALLGEYSYRIDAAGLSWTISRDIQTARTLIS
jgi:curved DNA-binding protein CbpA